MQQTIFVNIYWNKINSDGKDCIYLFYLIVLFHMNGPAREEW